MKQKLVFGAKKIIGIRGGTEANLRATEALAEMGFNMLLSKVDGQCRATILDQQGQPRKYAEGTSYNVALRRVFTGATDEELKGNERFTENV